MSPSRRKIDWFPALGAITFSRRNPGYDFDSKSEKPIDTVYKFYQGATSLILIAALIVGPYTDFSYLK